jgi:hypothetical protein
MAWYALEDDFMEDVRARSLKDLYACETACGRGVGDPMYRVAALWDSEAGLARQSR